MGKVRGRRITKKDIESSANKKEEEVQEEKQTFSSARDSQSVANRDNDEAEGEKSGMPFFGLVSTSELTYFHQSEQTLNINSFPNEEVKQMFIKSVLEESQGKELKLVNNQICSKLIERLLLEAVDSAPSQQSYDDEEEEESNVLSKAILQFSKAFKGNFVNLSKQKYASHVLESFIIQLASLIESELINSNVGVSEETFAAMMIDIVNEILPSINDLMADKYGSHVIRLILLILGGKELPSNYSSISILRSKKSKIARKMIEIKSNASSERSFQIPTNFKNELKPIIDAILSNKDTKKLRELAIDPICSPVIQLLIQLEGLVDKSKPFWSMIFNSDSSEGAFVEYLLSDSIGSHFFQSAIQQQKVKNIERLYSTYIKDKIVKISKRENNGVFVVMSIMEKLKPEDQKAILDQLVPILNELIVNNLDIGLKIIECSQKNGDYLKKEIIEKFLDFFTKGSEEGLLENVLKLKSSTMMSAKDDEWPTSLERRNSIFLENLMDYDSKIYMEVFNNLLDLPNDILTKFAKHSVFSHILEKLVENVSLDVLDKKVLLQKITPMADDWACHATASHVVDKLWGFTNGLNMFKERIARKLFDSQHLLKQTIYGKKVWQNWKMELYVRKFGEWKRLANEQPGAAEGEQPGPAKRPYANAPQRKPKVAHKRQRRA